MPPFNGVEPSFQSYERVGPESHFLKILTVVFLVLLLALVITPNIPAIPVAIPVVIGILSALTWGFFSCSEAFCRAKIDLENLDKANKTNSQYFKVPHNTLFSERNFFKDDFIIRSTRKITQDKVAKIVNPTPKAKVNHCT